MLEIFGNVVLPVLVVAALGYALQRHLQLSLIPLSQVSIYVLQPCLVFTVLVSTDLRSQEPLLVMLFSALLTGAMLVLATLVARLGRMDHSMSAAFMLSTAFPNVGNYGPSVVLLAYGQPGLEKAILVFVVQSIFSGTVAVMVASSSSASAGRALLQVFKLPQVYATAAALAFALLQVTPRPFIGASAELAAKAAIPLMLVMLGMQMARSISVEDPGLVGVAVAARLVAGVAVGYGIILALGISGATRDVLLIQAAMPTAVFTTLLATEFNARPRFVTSVVLATTVLSLVTVTVLLALLPGAAHLT